MKIINPQIEIKKIDGIQIMKNIEKACRTCYRSEDKVTEDSYKNLLKNCINSGHESILEHEKITIEMICDIGAYKDLTRHRIASFSIESTRYCAYDKDKFDGEISFIKPVFFIDDWFDKPEEVDANKSYCWKECMSTIERRYMGMRELGATPDECRMLLPHSTAAKVVMTTNIREWRHILKLRCSQATHPSVQQLMIPLLHYFTEVMPEIFSGIEYNNKFPTEQYAKINII